MKKLAILGSTGSIGENTLNVIRHLGEGYQVKTLAAYSNIEKLELQAKEFTPDLIAVFDREKGLELQKKLPHIEVVTGIEGLKKAASWQEANFAVSALVGTVGLVPTIAALESGKDLALANKEALISGGSLITSLVREKQARLIPIDSEHSAIFQCLTGEDSQAVSRIILTASGGPFREMPINDLKFVTAEQALKHPNWKMGPKITIDCSTLMNKGLEMIEARWLFNIPPEKIEIVIHPQSIIHSMVEFLDGSMIAQMSIPSMIVPIQYALTYPERKAGMIKPFDFIQHGRLEFALPDLSKFRCLSHAYTALKIGQSMPCYLNAANEVLVNRFLAQEICWFEIADKLEQLMQKHTLQTVDFLEEILEVDKRARLEAKAI